MTDPHLSKCRPKVVNKFLLLISVSYIIIIIILKRKTVLHVLGRQVHACLGPGADPDRVVSGARTSSYNYYLQRPANSLFTFDLSSDEQIPQDVCGIYG